MSANDDRHEDLHRVDLTFKTLTVSAEMNVPNVFTVNFRCRRAAYTTHVWLPACPNLMRKELQRDIPWDGATINEKCCDMVSRLIRCATNRLDFRACTWIVQAHPHPFVKSSMPDQIVVCLERCDKQC